MRQISTADTIKRLKLTKSIIKLCEDQQALGCKLTSVASHLKEDKLLKLQNDDCLKHY
ncbi:hypothetical protein OCHUTO_0403 [Orientia chuto str. Dubai]|uniref:Uncharacterized protein n=1 Tax=Orientia chuto str. Dubai TaxID=1359168 RepID=A0A0F3MM29_9RICK|nr:hypothetical protein [Candidatus Orientia mediorientalis]KJV56532.1 hypothetical protein OCHUTO_0403 [Orientia chuto str. Dubai]